MEKNKKSGSRLIVIDGNRRELEYKLLMKAARENLTEEDFKLLKKRGKLTLVHNKDKETIN